MSAQFTRVTLGRRMSALMVDWLACYFIVAASAGGLGKMAPNRSWTVLALFFAEVAILSALQGASLGHRIFGIKIIRFADGGAITPVQALIRSALLVTVIFAITFDENGRGMHERFSGSVLTRA
ncbi:MAG: RDD family protein [Actinomycetales bacterium]|nr:RDD family protein [Actinomycetales bacterium]